MNVSMPRGKMKFDEDLVPDREDDFQTDDEENQAERVFDNLDDDTESEVNNSPPSRNLSNEVDFNTSWPQSYRYSFLNYYIFFLTLSSPTFNFM